MATFIPTKMAAVFQLHLELIDFSEITANPFDGHDDASDGFSSPEALSVMQQTSRVVFQRWFVWARDRLLKMLGAAEKRQKAPLHTAEELECFKKDAIDNLAKHY